MGEFDGREFLKEFGVWILVGVVGVGVVGWGLWEQLVPETATVEIIKSNSPISNSQILKSETQIVVDVSGAVERPGVYKLPSGSRIGDALVAAGGVSAKADREWVAATINLAEKVEDGGKVYIPAVKRISESVGQPASKSVSQSGKININTASTAELDGLAGIGEVRATAIVANRPYANLEELVSKAKIPQSVYDKIKDLVSVY